VLDGVELTISKGARVGIIGSTGSGKSTALDLLMGLLEPTCGRIVVDGRPLNQTNQRAWQRTVAHVPQSIFLSDASISENIAFGIPSDKIDFDRVRKAAQQAQIADFIESRAEGYSAVVGERGVRLSGGQRQRIGIARALYKQASVLIFDEATSALDNETELAVMHTIEGLSKDLTLFIIAHRLTTLKNCDVIIKLEGGKNVSISNFESIFNNEMSSK
jgi:ATP-binding cassette subfamily B protein